MRSSLPFLVAGGGIGGLAAAGFPYGVIYRADLHQVFLDACMALPNVQLRTGARLESFTRDAASVRVTLAGGEVVEGAALIGADGLWRKVREAIVGDGKPRASGHVAYHNTSRRATFAPAGSSSPRASTATSITQPACRANCETRHSRAATSRPASRA